MADDDAPATTRLEDLPESGVAVPVLLSVHGGGKIIALREGTNLIGRGSSAFVRLDQDGVSRRHASIVIDKGTATLRDLGSTNGTFVSGEQVEQAQLEDGDVLMFGRTAEVRFMRWRGAMKAPPEGVKLSKRELEIARLVARGLGNEEVGAALGISRRTVSTHLSRIYGRLGVGSRVELARLLTDWGLAE